LRGVGGEFGCRDFLGRVCLIYLRGAASIFVSAPEWRLAGWVWAVCVGGGFTAYVVWCFAFGLAAVGGHLGGGVRWGAVGRGIGGGFGFVGGAGGYGGRLSVVRGG
jgi:hypothetical protein